MLEGLLLIDKPSGWTSFDVVAKVRGELRRAESEKLKAKSQKEKLSTFDFKPSALSPKVKVGHTGTLDPLATGLLVLTIGNYCKRAQEFSGLDKTYEVTMLLGLTSTTGDEEGEKTSVSDIRPSFDQIKNAIAFFIGKIEQTPPVYSAIKVNGQRAYKLARAGKEVKLEPREVTVYSIENLRYTYPELRFTTKVSSGTYIRSLVEDIGKHLGAGAYMTALRRTNVGSWDLSEALSIENLDANKITKALRTL